MIAGIAALLAAYRSGATTPARIVEELIQRRRETGTTGVWISQVEDDVLRGRAAWLATQPTGLPLYGVPFAIKDNIDLAGTPTTAGCPAFARTPVESATVVQRLLDAGAIAIGKTNLDQFATGLVGTRSPYGICHNSFDPAFISGGSSSGSAVAVARGLVAFALGTDTAGSGRVPAAFNNIVGYKPTSGRLSTQGVVPACRSLDAVSVFALTADDAARVARVATGFDAADPYSRPAQPSPRRGWSQRGSFRFAVPRAAQREFFGNTAYAQLFGAAITHLSALGGTAMEVDIEPFLEAARLLYQGPWVAERHLVAGELIARDPSAVLPVIREIIGPGDQPRAVDAFAAQYRLQALRRMAAPVWDAADVLLLPTAPTHYRIEEVLADPIGLNSRLGHYTNFVNLMDLAAVAVPAGFTQAGLPFGVSLVAPAHEDEDLLALGGRLQRIAVARAGALEAPLPPDDAGDTIAMPQCIDIAVCGAHMSGLPLNSQLTSRGAWLLEATHTTAEYRLHALPGGPPARPGMIRTEGEGAPIEMEIWRMPAERFGDFVAGIPAPLGIGRVRTRGGQETCGFLCEPAGLAGARDITHFGGWRGFLAHG